MMPDFDPQKYSMPELLIGRNGPELSVTINRPEKRNALSKVMFETVATVFSEVSSDKTVRVVTLRGSGGLFSAGGDISDFPQDGDRLKGTVEQRRISDAAVAAVAACPKPTVAIIDGLCIGGGLSLAMACDFRIASPGSTFTIPAAKLGLVYSPACCRRLASIVGSVMARRMLFLAEKLDSEQALAAGLIDTIGDPDELSRDLTDRLSKLAPLSIEGSKFILDAIQSGEITSNPEGASNVVLRAMKSEDFHNATKAFLEKRRPVFQGI